MLNIQSVFCATVLLDLFRITGSFLWRNFSLLVHRQTFSLKNFGLLLFKLCCGLFVFFTIKEKKVLFSTIVTVK